MNLTIMKAYDNTILLQSYHHKSILQRWRNNHAIIQPHYNDGEAIMMFCVFIRRNQHAARASRLPGVRMMLRTAWMSRKPDNNASHCTDKQAKNGARASCGRRGYPQLETTSPIPLQSEKHARCEHCRMVDGCNTQRDRTNQKMTDNDSRQS